MYFGLFHYGTDMNVGKKGYIFNTAYSVFAHYISCIL